MPSQTDCAGSAENVVGACDELAVCWAGADDGRTIEAASGMSATIAISIFICRLFQCCRTQGSCEIGCAGTTALPSSRLLATQARLFLIGQTVCNVLARIGAAADRDHNILFAVPHVGHRRAALD